MRIGFAQADITPKVGQQIIGWLKEIQGHTIIDPLSVNVAVLEDAAGGRAGFVALDTLCVRWTHAQDIRRRIEQACGFSGGSIMVSATHTHAGGAVANIAQGHRDEAYIERVTAAAADAFARAVSAMQPATLGVAHGMHHELAINRRIVMRDGTAKTHGNFSDPSALFVEGPIDPELTVLFAHRGAGDILGALVNFTCHPVHHGFDGCFSAGWPGAMRESLRKTGVPVTLFLNGAIGNIHHGDPTHRRPELTKEQAGEMIARDVARLIERPTDMRESVRVREAKTTLSLPFREATADQIAGTARGTQRFIDPAIYARSMPRLLEKIRKHGGKQLAEVQAIALDECVFVSIPAELFVEFGLAIKEKTHPKRALIVGMANGMIGYVPTKAAFARGGYETTFLDSSRMAPETGELLVDAAVELVGRL